MAVRALTLDGGTDWVTIPDHATLDITNPISISAWVKTSDTNARAIFGHHSNADEGGFDLAIGLGGSTGKLTFWSSGEGGWTSYTEATTVNDGAWHHVAVTFDSGTVTFYIDSTAMTATAGVATPGTSGQQALIGGYAGSAPTLSYLGLIDDLVITNTVLSAGNITSLYNGGTGRRADAVIALGDMAAYYDFDDDTVNDKSNNTNNGTLAGDATFTDGIVPETVVVSVTKHVSGDEGLLVS